MLFLFTAASCLVGRLSAQCVLTPRDVEGPYYCPGPYCVGADIPFRSILTTRNTSPLYSYSGHVLDKNCCPMANAVVDPWHADDDSEYYFEPPYHGRGKIRPILRVGINSNPQFPARTQVVRSCTSTTRYTMTSSRRHG